MSQHFSCRDTQFQGFAKALLAEIDNLTDDFCKEPFDKGAKALVRDIYASEQYEKTMQTLVAQRAYDLVEYAICHIAKEMGCDHAITFVPHRDAANCVPDMTEWPKEMEK